MIFDNIKKIAELKKLQDSFKKEKVVLEKRGVSVTMNGNFEVEEIKLNPEQMRKVEGYDPYNFLDYKLHGKIPKEAVLVHHFPGLFDY